jgi:type VI secretion system protein ImpA
VEVKKKALELASRTKDLRVGVRFAQALVRTDGLPGLRDALALLRGYLAQSWESVHPQLDPDDDDPTMRVNTLATLIDPQAMLVAVRRAPLLHSAQVGAVRFEDVLTAEGSLSPPSGSEPLSKAMIEGAARDCEIDDLTATADTCREARDAVIALEAELTRRVGAGRAADLSALPRLLGEVQAFLSARLAERGIGVASAPAPAVQGVPALQEPSAGTGEIRSRDDVVKALERISQYYQAHEPASPIPLLLERAKRLVFANFVELMSDLAPDALPQIESLRGRTPPVDDAK